LLTKRWTLKEQAPIRVWRLGNKIAAIARTPKANHFVVKWQQSIHNQERKSFMLLNFDSVVARAVQLRESREIDQANKLIRDYAPSPAVAERIWDAVRSEPHLKKVGTQVEKD
jgi:hypothetical protein